MNRFENVIASLDYILNNKKKRHITGGILLSVSLLFGGLALTVMTLREDLEDNEEDGYIELE